jgi:hypothetical protein
MDTAGRIERFRRKYAKFEAANTDVAGGGDETNTDA